MFAESLNYRVIKVQLNYILARTRNDKFNIKLYLTNQVNLVMNKLLSLETKSDKYSYILLLTSFNRLILIYSMGKSTSAMNFYSHGAAFLTDCTIPLYFI